MLEGEVADSEPFSVQEAGSGVGVVEGREFVGLKVC